ETGIGAFFRNRQKPLHAFVADNVRMRITGASLQQCGQLRFRCICVGMVGEKNVGSRFCDDVAKTPGGATVLLEPESVGSFRSNVSRPVSEPVESCAAPQRCSVLLSSILYGDERRNGPQSVTWCNRQDQRCVAESQSLAICGDHVTFGFGPRGLGPIHEIPVV